ncbi:MAG TPA: four helix bundle protein [Polyangiaceae bacterium]|jgi:four helix bundle protein
MALRIYDFEIETLRMMASVIREIARVDSDLARQLRRAAAGVALNTAEGEGYADGNRRVRFHNAIGSAKETRACLEVAGALEYVAVHRALVDRLDRIAGTLYRLAR